MQTESKYSEMDDSEVTALDAFTLRLGTYEINCRVSEDLRLPSYAGSAVRGLLGHCLRKTVCLTGMPQCADCIFAESCLYPKVFFADISRPAANGRKRPDLIGPPYSLFVKSPENSTMKQGSEFTIVLKLFGEVNDSLPYFIHAFRQAGHKGIGKGVSGASGQFTITSVKEDEDIIFCEGDNVLRASPRGKQLPLFCRTSRTESVSEVEVEILTPMRVKFENRLAASLPFHVLIRAALRRVSMVYSEYGSGEPLFDYTGLAARAREVETVRESLEWRDWTRYSSRQQQRMKFGGVIGGVRYRGKLDEFQTLLETAAVLHVGKQSSFGLGKFIVRRC